MWKLKIGAETVGEGGYQWLKSVNNHLGRQVWEFNPELGSPEELQRIEDARKAFWNNRFERRHSSDLLMRIQVTNTNFLQSLPFLELSSGFFSICQFIGVCLLLGKTYLKNGSYCIWLYGLSCMPITCLLFTISLWSSGSSNYVCTIT